MARFEETVNIQPISVKSGAFELGMSMPQRLAEFDNQILGLATENAVARGKKRAQQTKLEKDPETGLTITPKFDKVGILGRTEAQAHNKAIMSAYVSSIDSDLRENVARLQLENPDDIIKFNDKANAYKSAVLNNVDSSIRNQVDISLSDMLGRAGVAVQAADYKKQKEEAQQILMVGEKNLFDLALLNARNGDVAGSAEALINLNTNIDAQVDSGLITLSEGVEKKRQAQLKASNQNIIGSFRSQYLDKGDYVGALKELGKLDAKIPKNRTIGEHTALVKEVSAELNEALNIRNKIEDLEEQEIIDNQVPTFTGLFKGLVSPEGMPTNISDVVSALENKTITENQAATLTNIINNRGTGTDDHGVIFEVRFGINQNRNPQEIRNSIVDAMSNGRLTAATANELLFRVDEMENKESALNNSRTVRARDFIESFMIERGPMGAINFGQQQDWARAQREFDDRVLNGEDPFMVADDLVGKHEWNKVSLKYGSKNDLDGAEEILKQKVRSREIDKDTYNFEFNKLQKLKKMSQNINDFEKARKEQDATLK